MKPIEALLVEGTTEYVTLCYGVFSKMRVEDAYNKILAGGESSRVFEMEEEIWPNGLILRERSIDKCSQVPHVVMDEVVSMFDLEGCIAAICLYDGAFTTYDDLFSDDLYNQTYAFCLAKNEPVVALSTEVLDSIEWKATISLARKKINSRKDSSGDRGGRL